MGGAWALERQPVPSLHFIKRSLRPTGRKQWHPTPVLLPGKSHGRTSLVGHSPWGREESDTTERLHSHFSLSCTGEGNSNPPQCSCLENPRDGGAWWAAVYGVAQSWPRLKDLAAAAGPQRLIQLAKGWPSHNICHLPLTLCPQQTLIINHHISPPLAARATVLLTYSSCSLPSPPHPPIPS